MGSEVTGCEILDRYRNISNKLKKRFLRKPNVTEACDSFVSLGLHCEASELPAYAGLCWISAARCEGSLANITGETSSLVRAARQFLKAEENDQNLNYPSPSQENLQAAIGCYGYACSRYPDDCPLSIGLNMEIVDFLNRFDIKEGVEDHLYTAIQLSGNNLDTKIHCLRLLASHYIEVCHYTAALNVFTEIESILTNLTINGNRADILLKCELNRVFLLLILRPAPQKLSPNLTKLLEKYTWGDHNDKTLAVCGMGENMFLLIQSLVAICQSLDTSNLAKIESELWVLLEKEEQELLRILIRVYL